MLLEQNYLLPGCKHARDEGGVSVTWDWWPEVVGSLQPVWVCIQCGALSSAVIYAEDYPTERPREKQCRCGGCNNLVQHEYLGTIEEATEP